MNVEKPLRVSRKEWRSAKKFASDKDVLRTDSVSREIVFYPSGQKGIL